MPLCTRCLRSSPENVRLNTPVLEYGESCDQCGYTLSEKTLRHPADIKPHLPDPDGSVSVSGGSSVEPLIWIGLITAVLAAIFYMGCVI